LGLLGLGSSSLDDAGGAGHHCWGGRCHWGADVVKGGGGGGVIVVVVTSMMTLVVG